MRYWTQLPTEQFPPSALVRQAVAAERAGFDAANVSDHFQLWWEGGESGQAWTLLGAMGQATGRIGLGTGVTAPVYRYNPAVVARMDEALEIVGRLLDGDFRKAYILSSDPEVHADRIREIEQMGATVVCIQNASGADPERALAVYGDHVLPALRGARV